MSGNFQDDTREKEMCDLFALRKDETEGRSGIDAFLDFEGKIIPFELKTTSKGSVTTVRDFGVDHIEKWKGKHWLIGFFHAGNNFYMYGSPCAMSPWISSKEEYIAPDIKLAALAASKLTLADLINTLGEKDIYSISDAQLLQKKQYTVSKYRELMDRENGYSPNRMLEILQARTTYLMTRGSTLNNPHIPLSYFEGWIRIEDNHANQLRALVATYLAEKELSEG
ncbi:hypothetical protein LOY67_00570 [Pseudomonas sp. B21-056]|jgi:hypothetical protein|uniref:hypothetical protein n=1 Tax=Pseudomonas sp. B21-056 TaxID=2895495 RepID=UPI00222F2484|nr:hypothetical protein [Pseudomonas sp. B21-056]UZE23943.1 hypothetical protein LOY67_00570 [Pseudomonas sp. B21-056]